MAPGFIIHTCWIYSFFSLPLVWLKDGEGCLSPQLIPTTAQSVAFCDGQPRERPLLFKMNRAPSVGGRGDRAAVTPRRETMLRSSTWNSLHPAAFLRFFSTSSVTSVFRPPYTPRLGRRGDSCGFSKASQQLQAPHGIASVRVSQQYGLEPDESMLRYSSLRSHPINQRADGNDMVGC